MSTTTPPSTPPVPAPEAGHDRRVDRRRFALLTATSFMAAALPASAIAASWRHTSREPAVSLIGSGGGYSLDIRDGAGRLLVATGTDGRALLNGYHALRRPIERRLDVAVLAGGPDAIAVHKAVVDRTRPRLVLAFGGVSPSIARTIDWHQVTRSIELRLGNTLSIELLAGSDLLADPGAWAIVVVSAASRLVLLPSPASMSLVSTRRIDIAAGPPAVFSNLAGVTIDTIVSTALPEHTNSRATWFAKLSTAQTMHLRVDDRGMQRPPDVTRLT